MQTLRPAWLLLGLFVVGCSARDGETVPDTSPAPHAAPSGEAADGGASPANDAASPAVDAMDVKHAKDAGAPDVSLHAITPFSDEVWTWDETLSACGYSNHGIPFWKWTLVGREPADLGSYPLFIYLHGTADVADNPVAVRVVEEMAAHGYVAASVPYDSLGGVGTVLGDPTAACPIVAKKSQCLFGTGAGSAITKLCSRAKAACDRGIVLAGHSQGSWLATLAKNHEPRVRAVYGIGIGIHEHVAVPLGPFTLNVDSDLGSCLPPSTRALPADRLRVVDGEAEYAYGTSLQQDVRALTSVACPPGTMECLRPNGSGFSFFPNAKNQDGRGLSQHCYMANMPAGDCTASTGLNTNWSAGNASYSLGPSLAWLRSFAD
jgi:hypothetical protein